jgi:hypothetical protein
MSNRRETKLKRRCEKGVEGRHATSVRRIRRSAIGRSSDSMRHRGRLLTRKSDG